MLEWVSKKHREQKRHIEKEAALKQSLAEKVRRFQSPDKKVDSEHTEITINGKRIRVVREHITLQAVSPITSGTLR